MTRKVRVLLAAVIVVVILSGATWAFLTDVSAEATNVFTYNAEGLDADLYEPEFFPEDGKNLVPGSVVDKDPRVENTGELDEYVAIRLTFRDGKGTILSPEQRERLRGLITISYNRDDTLSDPIVGYYNNHWKLSNHNTAQALADDNGLVYIYTKPYTDEKDGYLPFEGADKTEPIFDLVTINITNTQADQQWLYDDMGGFYIHIEAAAVQYSAFARAMDPDFGQDTDDTTDDSYYADKALYELFPSIVDDIDPGEFPPRQEAGQVVTP